MVSVSIVTTNIYPQLFQGMLQEDRLILANVLSQIFLKTSGSVNLDEEFNYMLRSASGLQKNLPGIEVIMIGRFSRTAHMSAISACAV